MNGSKRRLRLSDAIWALWVPAMLLGTDDPGYVAFSINGSHADCVFHAGKLNVYFATFLLAAIDCPEHHNSI